MLITIFFLMPTMAPKYGRFGLFMYSNFFLHLFNPLLSIVSFACFEKTKLISFRQTFWGIVPLVIYAVYYAGVSLVHSVEGVIAEGYDWYGFFCLVRRVW